MASESKKYGVHLSALITQARLRKSFSTLKELFRELKPEVDYQTWLHAESGRRIPTPDHLIEIGRILGISRQDLIIAYCQDKFTDEESCDVLETFSYKKFVDVETLIEAKDHDRSDDYVLNSEQLEAIGEDLRLRLFLTYTFDKNYTSSVKRLMSFFKCSEGEVRSVLERLARLGLVELSGDTIKRIHKHTTIPKNRDSFALRKRLLIKDLDINISEDSYISNCLVGLTERSFKKILSYFDFAEANLIKLDKADGQGKDSISRYQFAIVANKVNTGVEDEE